LGAGDPADAQVAARVSASASAQNRPCINPPVWYPVEAGRRLLLQSTVASGLGNPAQTGLLHKVQYAKETPVGEPPGDRDHLTPNTGSAPECSMTVRVPAAHTRCSTSMRFS